jgi:chromosome segregation ATPase
VKQVDDIKSLALITKTKIQTQEANIASALQRRNAARRAVASAQGSIKAFDQNQPQRRAEIFKGFADQSHSQTTLNDLRDAVDALGLERHELVGKLQKCQGEVKKRDVEVNALRQTLKALITELANREHLANELQELEAMVLDQAEELEQEDR